MNNLTSETEMKFLKALAGLFSKEKVARVVTDPRICEPVFMMLESIKKYPHRWRVELDLPEYSLDKERHRPFMYYNDHDTSIPVKITDRGIGVCFEASIVVSTSVAKRLAWNRVTKQLPDEDILTDLVMARHGCYPSWLNSTEALELHAALSQLMHNRISKIQARACRVETRRKDAEQIEIERCRLIERERLIVLYRSTQR